MSKVPLPGLARNTAIMADSKLPENRNPFHTVGDWNADTLGQIQITIGDIIETTSDFTRKNNPNKRHWKAPVTFLFKRYDSRIIKMNDINVPYHDNVTYGTDFIYALLNRNVGNAIVREGINKDVKITLDDKRIQNNSETWWATVNGCKSRLGVVDSNAVFEPKDVNRIISKTKEGIKLVLDVVCNIKLTIEGGRDRTQADAFHIEVSCSRGCIKGIHNDVPPPPLEGSIPTQVVARTDVADQGLIDALQDLEV